VSAGFGGIIRNNARYYLSGFSGYINDSSNIMYIYRASCYLPGAYFGKKLEYN